MQRVSIIMSDNSQVGSEESVSFSNLKWMGVTMGGKEYTANPRTRQLELVECGPWRHASNGNPANVCSVIQSLVEDTHVLFVVERDVNRNVVVYSLEEGGGKKTVTPFWLMIPAPRSTTDLGDVYTEDLTCVETNLAYGVQQRVNTDASITLSVRAINGLPIQIKPDKTGSYAAHISMHGGELIVKRFMIFTEPRRWSPWPKTVELHVETHTPDSAASPITYHFEVP